MVFDNKRAPAETIPAIRDCKDSQVCQKSIELAKRVYHLTRNFPAEVKVGLVSRMRRAAVSIPSNLAGGHARNTTGEFVQFISHAEGSLAELDTQCRPSVTLGFCNDADTEPVSLLITELQKMLKGLRRKLGPSP